MKNITSILVAAFVALFLAVLTFVGIERLWLVNASTYPSWLVDRVYASADMKTIMELRAGECSHDPVQIFQKPDYTVMRCGDFYLSPSTRTYIAQEFSDAP